ncbi:MAG: hypothetical protein Q8L29_00560 [archaeon]|nr:hypothetical protein [archaeon]
MKKSLIFLFVFVFLLSYAAAATFTPAQSTSFVNYQKMSSLGYYAPEGRLSTYWPQMDEANKESCTSRQDILLQIAPGGCQPAVVRSDLLAEQNVPVFCQVMALQINPLINVQEISNIRFTGNYPKEIAGTGFHPAKAALRTNDILLGSPLTNNIGYVVVILKKNEKESSLPDFVNVTLSAQISYDAKNAFGIGRSDFILEPMTDEQWNKEKAKQSFWGGAYSIRAESVEKDYAVVSVYYQDRKISTQKIKRGETSSDLYLPGMYCRAALQLQFVDTTVAQTRAKLEIRSGDGTDTVDVYSGSTFLNDNCRVESIIASADGSTGNVTLRCSRTGLSSERFTLSLKSATTGLITDKNFGTDLDIKFNETIESYEKVIDYPQERENDAKELPRYGETALSEAIDFARSYGKTSTESRLIKKFMETYPDSQLINSKGYQARLDEIGKTDDSNAVYSIEISNSFKSIRLAGFVQPKEQPAAYLSIDSQIEKLVIGTKKTFFIKDSAGRDIEKYIIIKTLDTNKVVLDTNCEEAGTLFGVELLLDNPERVSKTLCGHVIGINRIETTESAKIRVIPSFKDTRTETNLTVAIGIEKRAIQLSPVKTQEKITELNKTIIKWEGISNNLAKVVTGMKGACFATAATLTFKNFLVGLSGEALARQKVMNGESGWKEFCKNELAKESSKYSSLDDCFSSNSDKIDNDVSLMSTQINKLNNDVKSIDSSSVEKGSLGENNVDSAKARQGYVDSIKKEFPDNPIAQKVNTGMTTDELRNTWLHLRLNKNQASLSEEGKTRVNNELGKINKQIEEEIAFQKKYTSAQQLTGKGYATPFYGAEFAKSVSYADVRPLTGISSSDAISTQLKTNSDITATSTIMTANGAYILGLQDAQGTGNYIPKMAINADTNKVVTGTELSQLMSLNGIGAIKKADSSTYNNPMRTAEVKYYETEPYKGMPAIVPFDTQRGWYAATKQTIPALGGIGAFDASGRVASFWLCNAGEGGVIEFEQSGFGNDVCEQINLQTGQSYDMFPGLSPTETKSLVNKAINSLTEASRQYKGGVSSISIQGTQIKVGKPAINIAETTCSDFMSPKECLLMFNLCDPVICPTSRCDLGGKYPVSDVVQTGIVGSVFLCLPNIREGIAMPVCLTGIQAGIDSYLSVMKSYRNCLQENLNTGQMIGVCDQVYSVYQCEFFWRQVAPVANVILPKLAELAYGQGTRGGGEYLTVKSSWDNMQNSINYFKESYAVNSLKAFQARSVEEAGGEFCKGFISLKSPKKIQSLLEPESPPQFYASFSSTTFTTATVPATAQYKVFYHIFAGKDAGTYYTVYLKSGTGTSFYYLPATVQVTSGFITKGEFKSETKDFTAPDGYKELCVRINEEEKCGFKQVSTDFAVNYLKDSYVQSEIEKGEITTEKECVSGSPSVGSLIANTNPQSALEETATPEIYNRGIVRVCATSNPGSSVDATRFVAKGYCGDKKIICWLDTRSVGNAITDANKGLQKETLQNLQQTTEQNLVASGEFDTESASTKNIADLRVSAKEVSKVKGKTSIEKATNVLIKANEVLRTAETIFSKLYLNNQKAEVLLIEAQVKRIIADATSPAVAPTPEVVPNAPATTPPATPATCGNNKIDENEQCDYTANPEFKIGMSTCNEIYGADYSGTLICDNDCKIDFGDCVNAEGTPSDSTSILGFQITPNKLWADLTDEELKKVIADKWSEESWDNTYLASAESKVPSSTIQFTLKEDSYVFGFGNIQRIFQSNEDTHLYIRNEFIYADISGTDQPVGVTPSGTRIVLDKTKYSLYDILNQNNFDLINGKKIEGTQLV